MDGYRRRLSLLVVLGLFSFSGANCHRTVQQWTGQTPPPRVLPPSPTIEQVIEVVNRNNARIVSGSATRAKLSVEGYPSLRAKIAFERPQRLRIQAETFAGPELDLGSNDEIFWFWIRRNQQPGVYFCRHDQFAQSRARAMIPIDPAWVLEALGVGGFDPALPHEGPVTLPDDRLEVITRRNTPEGLVTKSTIIDGARGWVLEQRLFDAEHQLIVRAVTSRHRQDPYSGLVMPSVVEIECPAAQFTMRLDLGSVRINPPEGHQAALWTPPSPQGVPRIDLCIPGMQMPPAAPVEEAALRGRRPMPTLPRPAY
jgi:hypothetical protein